MANTVKTHNFMYMHRMAPLSSPTTSPKPSSVPSTPKQTIVIPPAQTIIIPPVVKLSENPIKIGLLLIATNKYINFISALIRSTDEFFCLNFDVTYFLFTNHESVNVDTKRKLHIIPTEHKPWPWMTLGRYHLFSNQKDILSKMDYLYYCDADMLFVDVVGEEILEKRVVTIHPQNPLNSFETNVNSTAYVNKNSVQHYFAGGFNGGHSSEFLIMSDVISKNIDIDLSNNIIARCHDESHLNKYTSIRPPTKILSPSYCHSENWSFMFQKKILALDKNHHEYRS